MIEILYFARLRDALDCDGESLEVLGDLKVADLLTQLSQRGEPWRSALSGDKLLVAVNQSIANPETLIRAGDEVGIFPPVTGG